VDANARIEALEEERERLVEQIARLEHALGLSFIAPVEWRLTGSEARVVGALIARESLTKDAGMAALYRDFGKDEPEPKILDVFVCKIRKKLKPFGIEILTLWGIGYRLTAESRALLAPLLPDERVAA
jgi:two-component system cell cycle response regulator CtrA